LLLIQYARASQVDQALGKRRGDFAAKLDLHSTLTAAQQATYASSWLYGAVHIATSLSGLNTVEKLAKHFDIHAEEV